MTDPEIGVWEVFELVSDCWPPTTVHDGVPAAATGRCHITPRHCHATHTIAMWDTVSRTMCAHEVGQARWTRVTCNVQQFRVLCHKQQGCNKFITQAGVIAAIRSQLTCVYGSVNAADRPPTCALVKLRVGQRQLGIWPAALAGRSGVLSLHMKVGTWA
jgi:hypothetical protein